MKILLDCVLDRDCVLVMFVCEFLWVGTRFFGWLFLLHLCVFLPFVIHLCKIYLEYSRDKLQVIFFCCLLL